LSVRATEQLARRLAEGKTTTTAEAASEEEFPEVYTRIVEHLSRLLGEDIKIKRSADGSGKIIIGFAGDQQVADLAAKLERLSK
ncbi:MAG: chromosome partitioning protein ParB, partial [Tidjanibacter sp.]|nr:chromosome partitioning protein ParB [Tidjanibacter sp.]